MRLPTLSQPPHPCKILVGETLVAKECVRVGEGGVQLSKTNTVSQVIGASEAREVTEASGAGPCRAVPRRAVPRCLGTRT